MLPDYYQILGVSAGANLSVIKAAYKVRAMECHPDRGGSHERMVAVNEAWEILSHPELRRLYDEVRTGGATAGVSDAAQRNTREAKDRAQNYPKAWEDFEQWLRSLSADFKAAEYVDTESWPTVKNSISGTTFVIVGGIAGFIVGVILASNGIFPYIAFLTTVGGSWLGFYTHKCIRQQLISGAPDENVGVMNRKGSMVEAMVILPCGKCGQKLRLPATLGKVTITCPSCQHSFVR